MSMIYSEQSLLEEGPTEGIFEINIGLIVLGDWSFRVDRDDGIGIDLSKFLEIEFDLLEWSQGFHLSTDVEEIVFDVFEHVDF